MCFSLFMYSGVITKSPFHFYMSFISKLDETCMELLVLLLAFTFAFFAEFGDTRAKHNMKNAGKHLDGLLSSMTNHVRLSEEV